MIEAEQLTRRYGPVTAVDHLTFTAGPGHVTSFLGPNGSGKNHDGPDPGHPARPRQRHCPGTGPRRDHRGRRGAPPGSRWPARLPRWTMTWPGRRILSCSPGWPGGRSGPRRKAAGRLRPGEVRRPV